MIILIGGEKGGTGKTTLCTNLAAIRAKEGIDVLIVDTDKQGSASAWSATRDQNSLVKRVPCIQKFGTSIPAEIADLKNRYEDIIIDAGGRDSVELRAAMSVAQRIYIPIQASQFDVWTLGAMDSLVNQVKAFNNQLEAYVIINRASTNPSVSEAIEASEVLEDFDHIKLSKSVIRDRISFRKAARSGLSIYELQAQDFKANQEINLFLEEVFENVTIQKDKPKQSAA